MIKIAKIFLPLITILMFSTSSHADDDHSIDLKLFGKNVIEKYDGCRFALWQENKDPGTDRFAYIFFAPFNDGEALPGWMKVGDTVYELERKDEAGKDGLLDQYQLYKSHDNDLTLVMTINAHSLEGDVEHISDARITLIQDDKFPFRSRKLEGHIHCPANYEVAANTAGNVEYGELYGDAISLYGKQDYDTFNAVPKPILNHIRSEITACDLDNVPIYASSYKISEAMTLWEIPCALYARNAATVFATALDSNPDFFAFLPITTPPSFRENDYFEMLNARVNLNSATITSSDISPGEDCGTYEVHQLRAVEGEAIELVLTEFRDKSNCDDIPTAPENFPLIYSAR